MSPACTQCFWVGCCSKLSHQFSLSLSQCAHLDDLVLAVAPIARGIRSGIRVVHRGRQHHLLRHRLPHLRRSHADVGVKVLRTLYFPLVTLKSTCRREVLTLERNDAGNTSVGKSRSIELRRHAGVIPLLFVVAEGPTRC